MAYTKYSDQNILNRVYDPATNSLRVSGSSKTVGFYNPAGLDRFKKQIAKANQNSAGTGGGSIGVILFGDSLLEGMKATSYRDDTIAPHLRNLLQDKFNPPGVVGGEGYIPVRTGNTTATWPTNTLLNSANNMVWTPTFQSGSTNTALVNTAGSGNLGPINRKLFYISSSTTNPVTAAADRRIRIYFDNSFPTSKRRKLSSLDIVYIQSNDATVPGGTWTWDLYTDGDAFITAGTGAAHGGTTGTVNSNGAISGGKRVTIATGLSASSNYTLQISGPADDSNNAIIEGVIAYYGDESCGVYVHNFSRVGASTADSAAEVSLVSSFDVPQSRAGSPAGSNATNAYLYITDYITNDCNTQVSISSFKTNYATRLDRIIAGGSCVLMEIPPIYDATLLTKTIPYSAYINAIYELCQARPTTTAVMDFYKWSGSPTTATEMVTTMGWGEAVQLHNSDIGCRGIAQVLFDCIVEGVS